MWQGGVTNVQMVRSLLTLSIIKDENSIRKRAVWAKNEKLDFLVGVSWDTLEHPINSRLRKSWKDNYRVVGERRLRKILANF